MIKIFLLKIEYLRPKQAEVILGSGVDTTRFSFQKMPNEKVKILICSPNACGIKELDFLLKLFDLLKARWTLF
jgi:hypothetical protein